MAKPKVPKRKPPAPESYERYDHPRGPLPAMFKIQREDEVVEYTFVQVTDEGLWRSPVFYGTRRQIEQGVLAGFLIGRARWAEDRDGLILYGLDAQGNRYMANTSNLQSIRAWHRANSKKISDLTR